MQPLHNELRVLTMVDIDRPRRRDIGRLLDVAVRCRYRHAEDQPLLERPDASVFAASPIAPDRYDLAVCRTGRHLVADGPPAPTTRGCDAL